MIFNINFGFWLTFSWPTQKAESRKGIHIIKAVKAMEAMKAMNEFMTGQKAMFQLSLVISSIKLSS